MTVVALLLLLAVTDASFSGYRVAAGHDGRIFKGAYYRAATLRGMAYGLLWVGAVLVVAASLRAGAPDSDAAWNAFVHTGEPMLWVYGVYAAVVFSAFVPYLFGGIELRNLASVALFGPLTIVRPWVIAVGGVVALDASADPRCVAALAVALAFGFGADGALERWRRRQALP